MTTNTDGDEAEPIAGRQTDGVAFGQWVRQQRDRALMSQEDLAERAGVSVRTIQTLESGRMVRPRPVTRRLLSAALAAPTPAAAPEIPRQLPAAIHSFAGRRAEIERLDSLLLGPEGRSGGQIVVVSGLAGVGKTVLATHWANRAAHLFPDGQLHVTLRGFDSTASPTPPGEAIRMLLDGLGVGAKRLPFELDAQIALFRSLVASQRMLIMIDNVRDAEQVRPLLPGGRTCVVLVTSRDRLTGLAATHGAYQVPLDVPSIPEARELLAGRLGRERVERQPLATDEIIDRCARLPLALAVVAARAAAQPDFPLSAVAEELRDAGLGAFSGGDPASDVRLVLSWSYHALSAPARRLFRLLGLHPGPEVSAAAAASLAGLPVAEVRVALSELTQVHLLTEIAPGRYAFHDLPRAYAVEQAEEEQPADERVAAVDRMLNHYVLTARHAEGLLNPASLGDRPVDVPVLAPGVERTDLADHQALAWLKTEYPVLLSAHQRAVELGLDPYICQLALAVAGFQQRYGAWHDQVELLTAAIVAGRRLGTRDLFRMHGLLSHVYTLLGRLSEAETELGHAFTLAADLDDQAKLVLVHQGLAMVHDLLGHHGESLQHAEQVYAISERLNDPLKTALALSTLGWYRARAGDYERAVADCRRALAAHIEHGDRYRQASTQHSLGYAHHHLGEYDQALVCYQHSIALCRDLGERFHQAQALLHAGDSYLAMGALETARGTWQAAFDILHDLGHPDATSARERIDGIAATTAG